MIKALIFIGIVLATLATVYALMHWTVLTLALWSALGPLLAWEMGRERGRMEMDRCP